MAKLKCEGTDGMIFTFLMCDIRALLAMPILRWVFTSVRSLG